METLPVIAARQLAIGYSHGKNGSTVVHRDLSFDLWAGELTCLLGPNGAGKSTLLRTLSAFQLPLEGELWLEGVDLTFCQKLMSLFGITAQPGVQIHGFNLTSTLTVQNIRLILGTFAT